MYYRLIALALVAWATAIFSAGLNGARDGHVETTDLDGMNYVPVVVIGYLGWNSDAPSIGDHQ